MKKKRIILIIIGLFVFLVAIGLGGSYIYYKVNLNPIDKDSKENVVFTVSKDEPANIIIENLKKEGLIKDELTMKLYVKLHPGFPKAGEYILTKSMSAVEIYEAMLEGKVNYNTKKLTFIEGKTLSYFAQAIANNFDYTKEEVEAVFDDKEYIKTLIDRYSFLTEDILKDGIYHPLEGYLFADTYEFLATASIKEIVERMLDNTANKLAQFSDEIATSKYSIHELMTLASLIELEAGGADDRAGIAGVFYNRLSSGWTLGSDASTLYSVGKDLSELPSKADLATCNPYNTRGNCVKGLPIGPIAAPSLKSLQATMKPEKHDYYYFVADINGKTYFTKTEREHLAKISELSRLGLWFY